MIKIVATSLSCNADITMHAEAAHTVIPLLPRSCWRDVSSTNDEVPEVFSLVPLQRITLDHWPENGKDLRLRDRFAVNFVEALAVVTASEKHEVCARCFANKGDFSDVRSSTAIRASGHAHDDRVVPETVLFTDSFYFADQKR